MTTERHQSGYVDVEGREDNSEKDRNPGVVHRQHSAKDLRDRFRSSRNSDIELNQCDGEDKNDVFDDTGASSSLCRDRRYSVRSHSDSSLPDLVQSSSPRGMQNGESGRVEFNLGDTSPDVVQEELPRRKSILKLDLNSEETGQMRPKITRSVSFQDPHDQSAKVKRDSYRKSSGYGTGSSEALSLQSQNSQTSNASTDASSNTVFSSGEDLSFMSVDQPKEESEKGTGLPDFSALDMTSISISLNSKAEFDIPEPHLEETGNASQTFNPNYNKYRGCLPNVFDLPSEEKGTRKVGQNIQMKELQPEEIDLQSSVQNSTSSSSDERDPLQSRGISFSYSDTKQVGLRHHFITSQPGVEVSSHASEGHQSQCTSEGFELPNDIHLPRLSILSHNISEDGGGRKEGSNSQQVSKENVLSKVKDEEDDCEQRGKVDNTMDKVNSCVSDNSSESDQLPNFGALLSQDNDDSVQLPSNIGVTSHPESPSLDIVREKYCIGVERTSPEHHTAPITPSQFDRMSEQTSPAIRNPRQQNSMSTLTMREWQQIFLENPHIFEYEFPTHLRRLLNMPSDGSMSNSPSPNTVAAGQDGAMSSNDKRGGNRQEYQLTVFDVEDASRCMNIDCSRHKCVLVKALLIGLQHALNGMFSYTTSPEIQDLCCCLYRHATNCDWPLYRCPVPWCFLLRNFSDEVTSSVHLIFHWIKSRHDMPAMIADVIPSDLPDTFCMITSNHHHQMTTSFEVLYPLGRFGNVLVISEINFTVESVAEKMEEKDTMYVLKKIYNQDSSDVSQSDVYRRLIDCRTCNNLLAHYWMAEYESVIHICTEFILGSSLEEYLQHQILLNPSAVVELMVQICSAVEFLHNHGIIYLYWSSGNILLDNEQQRVVVSNLSLSVTEEDQDIGYTKMSLPPWLIAPEVLGMEPVICKKTDCWGAACLMVEMLTGHPVWHHCCHEQPEELWKKITDEKHNPARKLRSVVSNVQLLNVLAQCFHIAVDHRISFEDLHCAMKAMLN